MATIPWATQLLLVCHLCGRGFLATTKRSTASVSTQAASASPQVLIILCQTRTCHTMSIVHRSIDIIVAFMPNVDA